MDPALVYGTALVARYAIEGHEAVVEAVGDEAALILSSLKDRLARLVGDRIWARLSGTPEGAAEELNLAAQDIARTNSAALDEFRTLLDQYASALPSNTPAEYAARFGDGVGSAQFGSSVTVGGDIVGRDKIVGGPER